MFRGNEAFEAFETRAMAEYLRNGTQDDLVEAGEEKRRVKAFVDLHSYGQLCESREAVS